MAAGERRVKSAQSPCDTALKTRGVQMGNKVLAGQEIRPQAGGLGQQQPGGLGDRAPTPGPVHAIGPGTSPTVFVVDDDPAIRQSLVALLESDGLLVAAYATAEAFLEVLGEERLDAAEALVLSRVSEFVDNQSTFAPMIVADEDPVTQGQADGHRRDQSDELSGLAQVGVFGTGAQVTAELGGPKWNYSAALLPAWGGPERLPEAPC